MRLRSSHLRIASRRARGVTLLELLIVMTIMLMITAAAIPVMIPAVQNRRMREAARLLNSYIAGARSRAIESGRPAGISIQRFNGLPFSMVVAMVEVPPPYSGDTANARMYVTSGGQITGLTADVSLMFIRYGDSVKLGLKGQTYVIWSGTMAPPDPKQGQPVTMPTSAAPWYLRDSAGLAPAFPLPLGYANGVAFQIIRQPVRSSTAPLQLPEGIVIDLYNSGIGLGNAFRGSADVAPSDWSTAATVPVPFDPVILFSPGGSVAYYGTTQLFRPTDPMYLLLGRREWMGDAFNKLPTTDKHDENLFHDPTQTPTNNYLSNYWVAVGYQTGQVVTAENAVNSGVNGNVTAARAFARQAQSIGGR